MDTSDSRKLTYVDPRELDEKIPYATQYGTGLPQWYTTFGGYAELFRIPDAAYSLYIRHSQWPAPLTTDSAECILVNCDEAIVFLAKDIANAYLNGTYINIAGKAAEFAKLGASNNRSNPDQDFYARPYSPSGARPMNEWWTDPLVRKDP
jgi:hypothetical protein